MDQFILLGQRQANTRLCPVRETDPAPLTVLLVADFGGGEQLLTQQKVEKLAFGITVLAKDEKARVPAHSPLEMLFLVAREGNEILP